MRNTETKKIQKHRRMTMSTKKNIRYGRRSCVLQVAQPALLLFLVDLDPVVQALPKQREQDDSDKSGLRNDEPVALTHTTTARGIDRTLAEPVSS